MADFPIKVGNESGVASYASTLTHGEEQLLITRDGIQYITDGAGGYKPVIKLIDDSKNTSNVNTYSIDKLNSTYVKQTSGKSLIDDTKITKLDGISDDANKVEASTNGKIKIDGVEKTVFTQTQADWNETDNTKDGFIKNKPTDLVKINDSSTSSTTETYSINKIKDLIGSGVGSKSFEVVDVLPVSPSSDKIYILSTNYSLNYYDSSWHTLAGGSSDNQISIDTTAPTDTTKLWLDITDTSKPILKYYNGTSWINISANLIDDTNISNNTVYSSSKTDSTYMKIATYDSTNNGIVDKAETLNGMISTITQIDNMVSKGLVSTNIKAGTNINVSVNNNDVTINSTGLATYITNEW